MLKKILSPQSCASCRVCCEFDKGDQWENPFIENALADSIRSEITGDYCLLPKGSGFVFGLDFDKDGVAKCPLLTEKGCRLGDRKPFECRVWPLRIMKLNDLLVISVSPVCSSVSDISVKKLSEFVLGGIGDTIFKEAAKHPEIIKDYVDGYPIFMVKRQD